MLKNLEERIQKVQGQLVQATVAQKEVEDNIQFQQGKLKELRDQRVQLQGKLGELRELHQEASLP